MSLLEDRLRLAFEGGDPAEVWKVSKELVDLAKTSVVEAAKARYLKNFGGTVCEHCEGLKASPGVVATCFQVKQCYYGNFKEGDLTSKQLRVLRSFSG